MAGPALKSSIFRRFWHIVTSFSPATDLSRPICRHKRPHVGSEHPPEQGRSQIKSKSRSSDCAARNSIQYTFGCAEKLHFRPRLMHNSFKATLSGGDLV